MLRSVWVPEHVFSLVEHVFVSEDVDGDVPRRRNPMGQVALPNRQVVPEDLSTLSHVSGGENKTATSMTDDENVNNNASSNE